MISLGLTGYPLEHSLSPRIHRAALDACNLNGEYSLYPIRSGDRKGLKALLSRVRDGEICGLNVTIPHKQTVISLVDEIAPTAKKVGAVNTIYKRKDKLVGENTDAPGFFADLNKFLSINEEGLNRNKNALVLGSGGAARAVVYTLVHNDWEVYLAARRQEQAHRLIAQFPKYVSQIEYVELLASTFRSVVATTSLVVNTTPVGMLPDVESSPWPAGVAFPPHSVCYDLVYNPRETKFILDVRDAGLHAIGGLGMLIEQGALAFEIWTGHTVPRKLLFAAVEGS